MRYHPSTLLILSMLGACGGHSDEAPNPELGLSRFDSCAAMEDHLIDAFVYQMANNYGLTRGIDFALDAGMEDAEAGSTSSPSDFSTTNVQERGVDEPDMVKTDGDFVYVLDNGVLSIIDSWPAEDAKLIGEIAIDRLSDYGYATEKMFLSDDRILVFTAEHDVRDERWTDRTGLVVIDISNREAPRVIEETMLDGAMVSARMIGSDVYTVLSHRMPMPAEVYRALDDIPWWTWEMLLDVAWSDGSDTAIAEARERLEAITRPLITDAVRAVGAEDYLPLVTDGEGETTPMLSCTDLLHSWEVSSPALTTVVHVDLQGPTLDVSAESTGVMLGDPVIYASRNNLYIAQTSRGWWDGVSSINRETRIHRLALDGAETRYEATGVVDGYLHNQFSMSEHNGMLRVATTYDDWWWGLPSDETRSGNNVFILDAKEAQMGIIGAVTGLAPGEQIYATRFQGDRAFMVTFVQVDPLFTLDLSNPTEPKAVGELKIPGYSSYLHPFGEDHIIGIGVGGTWEGWLDGVAISLFDVSDFSDPKQQDQLTLECDSSWSEALWDHHAVLVYDDIVAIPAYGYSWSGGAGDVAVSDEYSDTTISGLMVADIDVEDGLRARGFIDHRPLVEAIYCSDEGEDCDTSFMPQMRRSLVIEGHLFSISDLGVMVSTVADPETALNMVPLL